MMHKHFVLWAMLKDGADPFPVWLKTVSLPTTIDPTVAVGRLGSEARADLRALGFEDDLIAVAEIRLDPIPERSELLAELDQRVKYMTQGGESTVLLDWVGWEAALKAGLKPTKQGSDEFIEYNGLKVFRSATS